MGDLVGVVRGTRREDGALAAGVQQTSAVELQGPLAVRVDAGQIGLQHDGEALGVHPLDLARGGVPLPGRIAGGVPGAGAGGGLHDVLVVVGQVDGVTGREVAGGHGRHPGLSEPAQIPLVGVPPHDVHRIGEPCHLRAPLGPRRELLGPPAVVPRGPYDDEAEPGPVHFGVVPVDDGGLGPGLPQRVRQHRQIPVLAHLAAGVVGDERDARYPGHGDSILVRTIETRSGAG